MPRPVGPGEPGYDPDRWFQHVVNVGLNAARSSGLGLSLFNALRSKFSGVASAILGAAASLIGQGVRAAAAWMQGGPGYTIDIDALPLAPEGFFGPEEVNRIVGLADMPLIDPATGETIYHQLRLNFPEDWSKAAIEDAQDEMELENLNTTNPKDLMLQKDIKSHMTFIGKRY